MRLLLPLLLAAAAAAVAAGGLGDVAEGAAAATVGAKCGPAPLDGYYCRVLNDPNAMFKGEAGCCGDSTKIIVTPGLIDSRNSTVSYAPKSVEDCNLMCAKNPGCLTASAFSNNGNLFCNMYGPSDCKYGRLSCNPTDADAPAFVTYGAWVYPCRSLKNPTNTGTCTSGHGHGVDGWHTIGSMAGMNMGRRRLAGSVYDF
jgi:hypothetical protein